jgi:hypothetical protein
VECRVNYSRDCFVTVFKSSEIKDPSSSTARRQLNSGHAIVVDRMVERGGVV